MLSGIINVNKPKGITSHTVVSRLRKILNIKKIGHTGTLDPMATGVLPICVGKTTRIIEYLKTSKAYRAYILLGVETNTYDMEGEILSKKPVGLDKEKTFNALNSFKGEITQIPPMHSAVHYKGKRLYEFARKNIEIDDIPKRNVVIKSINLADIENKNSDNPVLVVDINCSGGTYIRSIAHDLGEKLGCGACLKDLIRTESGGFKLDNSYTLEEIEQFTRESKIDKFLLKPFNILELSDVKVDEDEKNKLKNGLYLKKSLSFKENEILQVISSGELIAIGKYADEKLYPVKVLC